MQNGVEINKKTSEILNYWKISLPTVISQARSQTRIWGGATSTKKWGLKKKKKKKKKVLTSKIRCTQKIFIFPCGPPLVSLYFRLSDRPRGENFSDFRRFAP